MIILEEDEYIGEVLGATSQGAFNVKPYAINIGQTTTFPWGSQTAKNYEKYEFEELEFYYKREVSEFNNNGTVGKVMMSIISDASAGLPSNKQVVEDTFPHADGMPCENFRIKVPKNMLKKMNDGWFIRPGGLPGSADIKTYDVGQLFVCTQGIASSGATLGELHVKYRVKCFIPILETQNIAPLNNSISCYESGGQEDLAAGVKEPLQLTVNLTNGLRIPQIGTDFILPVGNYVVDVSAQFGASGGKLTSLLTTIVLDGGDQISAVFTVADAGTEITNYNIAMPSYFLKVNQTNVPLRIDVTALFSGTAAVTGYLCIQAV